MKHFVIIFHYAQENIGSYMNLCSLAHDVCQYVMQTTTLLIPITVRQVQNKNISDIWTISKSVGKNREFTSVAFVLLLVS